MLRNRCCAEKLLAVAKKRKNKMQKLMITLSTAVFAFGAFADGVTWPVGENFNASTEIPASITNAAGTETSISTTGYSYSKLTTTGRPDQFNETDAGNNLAIKTAFNAGQSAVDDLSFTKTEPTDASSVQFALGQNSPIATVNGTAVTSVSALNAVLASSAGAVVLLADVTGDLAFQAAGANTLDLGAYTLNGGVTSSGGSSCTLTISGTTGKIENDVLIDTDEVIYFVSGNIRVDTNPNICDNITNDPDDLKVVDGYYTVAVPEDGTAAKPWKIGSAADLADRLSRAATAGVGHYNFELTQSFALDGAFAGIDNFAGTFDGKGYTISGVKFASKGTEGGVNNYRGFFNKTIGATIRNLTIVMDGGFESGLSGEYGCAAFIGDATTNTVISNCVAQGTMTGTHNVAGIVVRLTDSTIKACTNKAAITGSYTKVAGIAALTKSSTTKALIEGCVNEGTITANDGNTAGRDGLAGIIAYTEDSKLYIKDCENKGALVVGATASNPVCVGQLLGNHYKPTVFEGTNKGTDDAFLIGNKSSGGQAILNNFATVNGGIATLVADSTLVAGGSYLVTSPYATFTITLAKDETIAFDKALNTSFAPTVNAASGCKITTATVGTVTTYTCETTTIAVTGVTLDIASTNITVGGNFTLTATVAPADATDKSVSWSTTDADVATVVDGVVTAVAAGSATITVTTTDGSFQATCAVTVTAPVQPVEPGKEVSYDTEEQAKAATNNFEVAVPAAVASKVTDQAAYKALFKPTITQDGEKYVVKAEFKPEVAAGLKTDVDAATESIAIGNIAAAADPSDITITNSVPGLYYQMNTSSTLDGFTAVKEVIGDGNSITFQGVAKPSAAKGFYKVSVSAAPVITNAE